CPSCASNLASRVRHLVDGKSVASLSFKLVYPAAWLLQLTTLMSVWTPTSAVALTVSIGSSTAIRKSSALLGQAANGSQPQTQMELRSLLRSLPAPSIINTFET